MKKIATLILPFNSLEQLSAYYKENINNYPKFYKMDPLSKVGFIASEMLLDSLNEERFVEREDRAIILIGKSASVAADKEFQQGISNAEGFFPSPSIFVYTLPNIVTGEIAIRNKYYGESEFYIIDKKNDTEIERMIKMAFLDSKTTSVLGGWIDCDENGSINCELNIFEK